MNTVLVVTLVAWPVAVACFQAIPFGTQKRWPYKASSTIRSSSTNNLAPPHTTTTEPFQARHKNLNQQLGEFSFLQIPKKGRQVHLQNLLSPATLPTFFHDTQGNLTDASSSLCLPFTQVWDWQKEIMQGHLDRLTALQKKEKEEGNLQHDEFSQWRGSLLKNHVGSDTVLFVQHQPVYTLGTASDPSFIHANQKQNSNPSSSKLAVEVVRIERGGEVTYHGPGQLVVYPILDLRGYKQDIHWYMRAMEEVVLLALRSAGVEGATRVPGLTGIFVDNHKVAAFGMKLRRWVTMHGMAINIHTQSLQNFEGIVPCGLEGCPVGCVEDFIEGTMGVEEFAMEHVKPALEEVFCVDLKES